MGDLEEKLTGSTSKPGFSRRNLIKGILAAAIASRLLAATPAFAYEKGNFNISYFSASDQSAVLDYLESLSAVLGPDLRSRLRVVKEKKSGSFVLVYERAGTEKDTKAVAKKHSDLLQRFGLDEAVAVDEAGYQKLYNISYGLGPNFEVLKKNYDVVSLMLGPNLEKNLVIEQTKEGNYALVYRKRDTLDRSRERAERLTEKLKGTGISASYIRDNNNEVVYSGSSRIEEEIEQKPHVLKKPPVKKTEPEVKKRAQEKYKPAETPKSAEKPRIAGTLQHLLVEQMISESRNGALETDEKYSFYVRDLTSGETLVRINEYVPRQTASMVKPFLGLMMMHKIEHDGLNYKNVREDMRLMLQKSDNDATNRIFDLLGGPRRINDFLRTQYSHIFKQTSIVENIPPEGKTYKNKASASDHQRFLEALYKGDLPEAKELRRLMSLPKRNRVYDDVPSIPRDTIVVDKTGSTARLTGDMAILYAKGKDGHRYPYTLVGIIEKENGSQEGKRWNIKRGNVIRRVSNTVYGYMQRKYDLIQSRIQAP